MKLWYHEMVRIEIYGNDHIRNLLGSVALCISATIPQRHLTRSYQGFMLRAGAVRDRSAVACRWVAELLVLSSRILSNSA